MGIIRWYKRDPNAALAGMLMLTLEERGAYNTILDLIYAHDGQVIDDSHYLCAWLGADPRVWRRVRQRLLSLGKLYIYNGHLRNARADREVDSALTRVALAAQAGNKSALSRGFTPKQNKDLPGTTVQRPFELSTSTSRKILSFEAGYFKKEVGEE